jgi:hypothetical protein
MFRILNLSLILTTVMAVDQPATSISTLHPGDRDISKHPAVLFAEDFEAPTLTEISKHWTEVKNPAEEVFALTNDVPIGSLGRQSLRMTATRGRNDGGHLWKLFDRGVDTMHARFYVKFAKDHPYVHHFVKIGAWRDSPRWPQGEAGKLHDGARSFQTGIEPGSGFGQYDPPGAWNFYTYWQGMRSWQGPNGTSFYGNGFAPSKPAQIPRNLWQCVEFMVKANSTPTASDGEQAFWIDGVLIGRWAMGTPNGTWKRDRFIAGAGDPFPGFQWRSDVKVQMNVFWLLYYMEQVFSGQEQYINRTGAQMNNDVAQVWFDHVVVATQYIGPLVPIP